MSTEIYKPSISANHARKKQLTIYFRVFQEVGMYLLY